MPYADWRRLMPTRDQFIPSDDGKTVYVKRTFDAQPAMDRARMSREVKPLSDEIVHLGSVPMELVNEWCKEEGVAIGKADHEQVRQIVERRLMSGDFNKFRGDERLYRKTNRAT